MTMETVAGHLQGAVVKCAAPRQACRCAFTEMEIDVPHFRVTEQQRMNCTQESAGAAENGHVRPEG